MIGLFTGPSGRAALIEIIVRSGKDTNTTKPFELDSVRARVALRKARSAKRILWLNSPSLGVMEDFRTIREWRREQDLGQPIVA